MTHSALEFGAYPAGVSVRVAEERLHFGLAELVVAVGNDVVEIHKWRFFGCGTFRRPLA